jgi:MFS transporter, ACDE family, multidrug resistance protein
LVEKKLKCRRAEMLECVIHAALSGGAVEFPPVATMREKKRGERGDGSRPVWKDHNLHVIWGVTLMAVLGSPSVSPAFLKVAAELGVSPGQVGLLITVFTLPGVFLTPVAGVLSDKFGRKTVLIPSLLLFGVAGGACALARDFELLLGLRVLQGVGAATLGATNVP